MALTKVRRGGTDTGITDSSDATAITIDSSERVGIGGSPGSGETLTVTRTGADATVRINGVSSQEAALKLQGNNTVTNTFKIASEQDDTGLTIQKWNGSAYVTHIASNANGIVTTPNIPCFSVTHGSQSWSGSNNEQVIAFASEDIDNGGHFNTSNYRFTAPVAGHYFFTIHAHIKSFSTNAAGGPGVFLRKNGSSSTTLFMYIYYTGYKGSSVQGIVNLAANDYITGAAINYNSSSFELGGMRMSGFLLG